MATQVLNSSFQNTSKGKTIALWTLQILGAAMFAMAGFGKLSGNEMHVGLFEAIGIGQWFRYFTGVVELGSAILLLVPALSGVGALLLSGTMVGAIATHLFIVGGSFAMPAVLLIAMLGVAYGRKDQTLKLIGRA
jgi:putative oxidoreductase